MAIYGIGCVIDNVDVGDDFYRRDIACIGWMPEGKPYLYGIMKEIDIGDIFSGGWILCNVSHMHFNPKVMDYYFVA